MKESRVVMGMPVTVEIVSDDAHKGIEAVFEYLHGIDLRFSPYRSDSEVSKLNSGGLALGGVSEDFSEILREAERTRQETGGYFDIRRADGSIDPSGIVKGWAIQKAADLLTSLGYENFCIDVGGDVAVEGVNALGGAWSVGIRNPFDHDEVVKVLYSRSAGVATSGSAARGDHIYNPHDRANPPRGAASVTVVGPTIHDADRFATAAFAMGKSGIAFIESLPGFEGYLIEADGVATMTSGFEALTHA